MMKVKVQFGNDIRKWRYPDSKRYQNLLIFIKQTFGFVDGKQFYVQFEDDEGDRLTLTSETDFEDAFSSAEQEGRKSLKIFVIKGSIEDSHNSNNEVLHSFSISSPASTSSRVQSIEERQQSQQPQQQPQQFQQPQQQPQQVKPKINEQVQNDNKKPQVEVENEKEEKSEESSQQNNTCHEWRQMAIDFLQNQEIQSLLPQLVRRFISELRKEQQQPISNQKSLLAIIHEVLGEDQFKPIVRHALYSQKIVFLLPHIVEKLQLYQGLLLTFNEDAIVSWVPHLINTLINSISHFENINVEIDIDPMYSQFCPFFNMQQQQQSQQNSSNVNENIHSSVTCDNCQCCPITGPRYKCSVCSNYDLCSKCEASGKHDTTHPLLKITSPVNSANQDYAGLHEFLKWSSRRGGRHCPRGHHFWSHHHRRFGGLFPECRNNEQQQQQTTVNDCANSCPRERCNTTNKLSAQFIEDVNIPDRSYCPADTVMTKIWKLCNDGDVEWGNDVELVFLKGNECLVLEKRYAVPNAKPGEKVDVSAVIKTPLKNGRYCTYFRLQKNGVFFGPSLWVELFAVAENDQTDKTNVICMCGEKLVGINPREAYNNRQVFCDICNRKCLTDSIVYHCPQNRNLGHPEGYDICINCANVQNVPILQSNLDNTNQNLHQKVYVDIQIDVPKAQQKESNNNNNNNNNIINNDNDKKNDDQNIVNKKIEENQIKIEDFDPIPLDSGVIVNENNQGDNMSLSNHSEPEIIEMKDLNDQNVNVIANQNNNQIQQNQEDNFEFNKELNLVLEMGFYDVETIKKLLIQYKGDVQNVIQQLLQA